MTLCEMIARNAKMSHVVLTVFLMNAPAFKFYDTIGYAMDPSSPQLWGDDDADYQIRSKNLGRKPGTA